MLTFFWPSLEAALSVTNVSICLLKTVFEKGLIKIEDMVINLELKAF
jgi:hypothetical protein